ncbi:MAG: esterase-like activity of phytase family protein [Verrucomicrobiales bacterium]|nr:esterase-like activity of phytase family protein [Verrucomicrobiales bacterium]
MSTDFGTFAGGEGFPFATGRGACHDVRMKGSDISQARAWACAFLIAGVVGGPSNRAAEGPLPQDPLSGSRYELTADRWWLLNLPDGQRVDASGLVRFPNGDWWVVNDQRNSIYQLEFPKEGAASTNSVDLLRVPGLFEPMPLKALGIGEHARLDCEGLALDGSGRVYLCEEARRWILRWDPSTKALSRLPIQWGAVAKYFHPTDFNASFEGIAVSGDRLYVANERQEGRIIVVDVKSLAVVDDFMVAPSDSVGRDHNYSDLCWSDGSLWVLMRDVRKVLRVDVRTKSVIAEFDYGAMETARPVAYGALVAPGFMEGLVVDEEWLWLLSDNNGVGRRANLKDIRPTLFRCRRPDRQ